MNEAEYCRAKGRIERVAAKWKPIIASSWDISQHFYDGPLPDGERGYIDAVAETRGNWYYKHAMISWSVEHMRGLDDAELDRVVIHELIHCVLDAMTCYARNEYGESCPQGIVEQTTTEMTWALYGAYTSGWNEGVSESQPDVYDQMAASVGKFIHG